MRGPFTDETMRAAIASCCLVRAAVETSTVSQLDSAQHRYCDTMLNWVAYNSQRLPRVRLHANYARGVAVPPLRGPCLTAAGARTDIS